MHEDRDPKHARQTGHYRVSGQPRGVLFVNVPSTKKRWPTEASDQTKTVLTEHFKMEGIQRPAISRRLDGKDRPDTHVQGGLKNFFISNVKTRRTSFVYRSVCHQLLGSLPRPQDQLLQPYRS